VALFLRFKQQAFAEQPPVEKVDIFRKGITDDSVLVKKAKTEYAA
jgi:hypothetical protein